MTKPPTPVTIQELADAGTAMFGSTWQTELANHLQINDRTLRRWIAGEVTMPPNLRVELLERLNDRKRFIEAAIKRIDK